MFEMDLIAHGLKRIHFSPFVLIHQQEDKLARDLPFHQRALETNDSLESERNTLQPAENCDVLRYWDFRTCFVVIFSQIDERQSVSIVVSRTQTHLRISSFSLLFSLLSFKYSGIVTIAHPNQ